MATGDRSQSDRWQVELDADDAAAYVALATDRLWNGYSIADLEPPFRAHARVALAWSGDESPTTACLFLRHPDFSAIIPHGDPAGLAAILDRADLPPLAYLLARPQHRSIFDRHYAYVEGPQPMLRLAVDRRSCQPLSAAMAAVERLSLEDLPRLRDLYAGYQASAFNPDQLRTGPFYGVWAGPALLAAGGIHASSARHGIAAIGNFYTRPEARGRGYGTAIAAAVVGELLVGPCEDVILNVATANTAARRVYHRLGFHLHCDYLEGRVARR
jgi:ribosomal protein S18 acetylase RimI-like enzyme